MPIPVIQLQAARLDARTRAFSAAILAFLKRDPELAYSDSELRQEVLSENTAADEADAFIDALTWLSDLGAVDQRVVQGEDYYLFQTDVAFPG